MSWGAGCRACRSWALPLAMLAFLRHRAGGLAERRPRGRRPPPRLAALLMPPLVLLGCVGDGLCPVGLAALISGERDPSFAHPAGLAHRAVLRRLGFRAAGRARRAAPSASWLWLAGLGIASRDLRARPQPLFHFSLADRGAAAAGDARGRAAALALLLAALAALAGVDSASGRQRRGDHGACRRIRCSPCRVALA